MIDTQYCPHKKDDTGKFGHQVPRAKMSYIIDARGNRRPCCEDCKALIIDGRQAAKRRNK